MKFLACSNSDNNIPWNLQVRYDLSVGSIIEEHSGARAGTEENYGGGNVFWHSSPRSYALINNEAFQ